MHPQLVRTYFKHYQLQITMDIRSINCLVAVMVFILVPFIEGDAQDPALTTTTTKPSTSPTTKLTVANGQTTKAVTTKPPSQGLTGGPQPSAGTDPATVGGPGNLAPQPTTPAPIKCAVGSCTVKGDDESCIKNVNLKQCTMASTGSCTTDVTKNATHTVVKVGCSPHACPTPGTPTTSTAKPSTTTSTCCNTNLCNQIQNSAAVRLTSNMLYAIGLILIKTYL